MTEVPHPAPVRLLPDARGASPNRGDDGLGLVALPRLPDDHRGNAMLSACLAFATVGAVVAAAYVGRLSDALVVIVGLLLVPLFLRRPLLLVFAYLVVSTNLLETLPLRSLAVARLGPGLTLRTPDILLMLMALVSLVRLRRRGQRPMFLVFVLIWIAYAVFQVVYGYIVGETGFDLPTNMSQAQVGWLLYFLIVGLIDSPRDLKTFAWFFLAIMAIAVVYQVAEYAHGSRILLFPVAFSDSNYFTFTPMLDVGGAQVPYLWSRASEVTIAGFFLAFAAALGGRRSLVYGVLAAAGLLSIAMTQIRGAYFGVAVGILAVIGLRRWSVRSSVRLLVLGCVLVIMMAALTPLIASSFGGDPMQVWVTRASSLVNWSTQTNWVKRANDASRAWAAVKKSPVVGFGWGATYSKVRGESGMNVLIVYGFLGTVMILTMYMVVLVKALRLARRLKPSLEQAWILGLVGLMVTYLAMTPTSDVLLGGGIAVVAAVFVDRISEFERDGLLSTRHAASVDAGQ